MNYYKITGLNEGLPIEPIAIAIESFSREDKNKLDSLLNVGCNDTCRYYEEISKDEYNKLIKANLKREKKRQKEKLIKYMRENMLFSDEEELIA